MIPPIWINIRVGWIWIPCPVVLLWPVLVLAWVILGLFLTGVAMATGATSGLGQLWPASWRLLCSMRGVWVEVEQANLRVHVSIV